MILYDNILRNSYNRMTMGTNQIQRNFYVECLLCGRYLTKLPKYHHFGVNTNLIIQRIIIFFTNFTD